MPSSAASASQAAAWRLEAPGSPSNRFNPISNSGDRKQRTPDGVEKSFEAVEMRAESHFVAETTGAGAQRREAALVAEHAGQRRPKRLGGWRRRDGDAIHLVPQPLRDASDIEGHGRHASRRGFEADQAERLRPGARQ